MPFPSRRRFLVGLAAGPLALALSCSADLPRPSSDDSGRRRPLPIPPLADSIVDGDGTRTFTLRAAPGSAEIVAGTSTSTWGYNGSILGPTLRARDGETVAVDFENALPVPSTVHWHGMHLPARCDGGPHQTVAPGGRWRPTWTIRQPAATLWYHPHPHGQTEKHLYRGLAGLFIVDDDASPDALPHHYGVDDIPLVVQDRKFTATGALDESDATDVGLLGDTIVTNGIAGAYLPMQTARIRLRILNGSGGRLYNLGFAEDLEFHLVASDGGLLSAPVAARRVQVSPGERVEIVVTVMPGSPTVLRSFPIADRAGLPPHEAHRFGVDDAFDVLEIRPRGTLSPSAPLPTVLAHLPTPVAPTAAAERSFDLQWHMINHERMDMDRVDFCTTVDVDEVWTVRNVDDWPHNFHVHDTRFRILDVDGSPPPAALAGYKDTVYTPPGQRIRLALRFADYTDRTNAYMYHCHLAMHEDQGMMGQFLVLAPGEVPAPQPMGMAGHAMR
ncbi:twin-arginine translocation signal domain-containing protein [Mycolicibacterium sp. P1-18]|uniref:multicopper oxidase family protein n=1 Tax=Mycolicibacterium sp. P1-18 TaxID=2024615 RepID=UPI0011F2537C|nr:multicopper oxidase domain-containing protein [Mycolicibacterium sp. P1-18]KAA0101071.1 twin-arginine translocation signal domain-containing protein [Mycolicibacterium sp. P1-18]